MLHTSLTYISIGAAGVATGLVVQFMVQCLVPLIKYI